LFRKQTKFKDGFEEGGQFSLNNDYIVTCFDYIHTNPIKAGLVTYKEDLPYSSLREYKDKEGDGLVNKSITRELGLVII
jgi:hypothetical protein